MGFLGKLIQGINMLPFIIQGVEAIFGKGNGKTKKDKALELFNFAAGVAESIAAKDIVDQEAFSQGAKELNDAVVKMLNASLWHKSKVGTPVA